MLCSEVVGPALSPIMSRSVLEDWRWQLSKRGIEVHRAESIRIYKPGASDDGALLDPIGGLRGVMLLVDALVREIGPCGLRLLAIDRGPGWSVELHRLISEAAVRLSACPTILDASTAKHAGDCANAIVDKIPDATHQRDVVILVEMVAHAALVASMFGDPDRVGHETGEALGNLLDVVGAADLDQTLIRLAASALGRANDLCESRKYFNERRLG